MKTVIVTSYWDGDSDCDRYTFETTVDGTTYLLAPCALDNATTYLAIEQRIRTLFGHDVGIEFGF